MKNFKNMHKRVIIGFFWLICLLTTGSTIQAADSLKITQISRHWVDSANKSVKKMVISQLFYTKDNTLFREINYSETTGKITGYRRFFYKNGSLFTEETFNSEDSLMFILKYDYNSAGDLVILTKLVPEKGSLVEDEKTSKTYDSNHKLLTEKKAFRKKTGSISAFSYNTAGYLATEIHKYKKAANTPLKVESRTYSYSPDNQLKQVLYTSRNNSGLQQYTEEYSYNEQGKLAGIRYTGKNPPPVAEKVYKYYINGKPRVIEDHDAAGKITYLLHYEYKETYMDRGTQVSYYENL